MALHRPRRIARRAALRRGKSRHRERGTDGEAFTDTRRLHAFANENRLTSSEGNVQILSMPVASILPTMAGYAESGATHIHFNADNDSYGFYIPLVQLPIIRQHLEKRGLL